MKRNYNDLKVELVTFMNECSFSRHGKSVLEASPLLLRSSIIWEVVLSAEKMRPDLSRVRDSFSPTTPNKGSNSRPLVSPGVSPLCTTSPSTLVYQLGCLLGPKWPKSLIWTRCQMARKKLGPQSLTLRRGPTQNLKRLKSLSLHDFMLSGETLKPQNDHIKSELPKDISDQVY